MFEFGCIQTGSGRVASTQVFPFTAGSDCGGVGRSHFQKQKLAQPVERRTSVTLQRQQVSRLCISLKYIRGC